MYFKAVCSKMSAQDARKRLFSVEEVVKEIFSDADSEDDFDLEKSGNSFPSFDFNIENSDWEIDNE